MDHFFIGEIWIGWIIHVGNLDWIGSAKIHMDIQNCPPWSKPLTQTNHTSRRERWEEGEVGGNEAFSLRRPVTYERVTYGYRLRNQSAIVLEIRILDFGTAMVRTVP